MWFCMYTCTHGECVLSLIRLWSKHGCGLQVLHINLINCVKKGTANSHTLKSNLQKAGVCMCVFICIYMN